MNIRRVRNSTQDYVYELSKYEYDALTEENARLKRENAELRACANIDEALGALEDDPDRQTAGQRKWHLYFDGLYNEMPY